MGSGAKPAPIGRPGGGGGGAGLPLPLPPGLMGALRQQEDDQLFASLAQEDVRGGVDTAQAARFQQFFDRVTAMNKAVRSPRSSPRSRFA